MNKAKLFKTQIESIEGFRIDTPLLLRHSNDIEETELHIQSIKIAIEKFSIALNPILPVELRLSFKAGWECVKLEKHRKLNNILLVSAPAKRLAPEFLEKKVFLKDNPKVFVALFVEYLKARLNGKEVHLHIIKEEI